jgi:endonuclease-8
MEGASLVIACEELKKFFKQKVILADGSSKQVPFSEIRGTKFKIAKSWGKHLLLFFEKINLRIHFLMWGSYRIDENPEGRIPRLTLQFKNGAAHFYSCSIKVIDKDIRKVYDWSSDLMSKKWDPGKAFKKMKALPKQTMVCDALMDQNIFSGLGNIIKNEVLFNLRIHPETRLGKLSAAQIKSLIREARLYSFRFYKWKKIFQLKRNWKIFRKKICPVCLGPVRRRVTGKGQRLSHYCESCQIKY